MEGYQDDAAEFSVEDVEGIDLQQLNRPFKYVITCVIMQKNGAGLITSASMHWDSVKDGLCRVPWQNST
eukprot:gene3782-5003_t